MDHFARNQMPLVTTLLIVFLSAFPTQLPMQPMIAPSLTLIAVYYWTVYRPDLLNSLFILLLGLLQDLLTGAAPGVSSFILLLTYLLVVSQRRFFSGKSFSIVWWGFMLVAPGAATGSWLANTVLARTWIDPMGPAVGLLLTILLYPPLAFLLSQAHKIVPARNAQA